MLDITKIKIGSSLYNIKDAAALTRSDATKLVNLELYGSESKPNNVSIVTSQNIERIINDIGIGTGGNTGDGDTKNTTGSTNKQSTKMFLVGAETHSDNVITYSNDACYIGTDNCIYSNGKKTVNATDVANAIYTELYGNINKPANAYVITNQNISSAIQDAGITGSGTDTKNTAGSTNTTDKIFLIGSTVLGEHPLTYSNNKCYVQSGYLYSNGSKTTSAQDVSNAINTELYGSATKPSGAYAVTNQNISNAISDAGINIGGGGVSTYYQLGYSVSNINGSGSLTIAGTDPIYVVTVTSNISSVTLRNNPTYGHSCNVIFKSADFNLYTVVISNDSTNRICPTSDGLVITVPPAGNGYAEVDFLNTGNSSTGDEVYVRGV